MDGWDRWMCGWVNGWADEGMDEIDTWCWDWPGTLSLAAVSILVGVYPTNPNLLLIKAQQTEAGAFVRTGWWRKSGLQAYHGAENVEIRGAGRKGESVRSRRWSPGIATWMSWERRDRRKSHRVRCQTGISQDIQSAELCLNLTSGTGFVLVTQIIVSITKDFCTQLLLGWPIKATGWRLTCVLQVHDPLLSQSVFLVCRVKRWLRWSEIRWN